MATKQVIEAATAAYVDQEIARSVAFAQNTLAKLKDNDARRDAILRNKETEIRLTRKHYTVDATQLQALKEWNRKHADACIARVRGLASNLDPAAWSPYMRCVPRGATEVTVQCPADLDAACIELLEDRLAAEITAKHPNVRASVHLDEDVLEDEVPEDMTQIAVELVLFDNSEWSA